MAKPMVYKEENGTKYKISFSEQLQMRVLDEQRKSRVWQRRNFYVSTILIFLFLVLTIVFLFLLYRLDQVDFFTTLMYR